MNARIDPTPAAQAPTIIKPSIGRSLWYWSMEGERDALGMTLLSSLQPFDAKVIFVHSDAYVNLMVTDHVGVQHYRGSVLLLQEGDMPPNYRPFAEWVPHQTGQAKKASEPAAQPTEPDPQAERAAIEMMFFSIAEYPYPTSFTILPDGRTTVCLLTLPNGFSVTGSSVCAMGTPFDKEVGESCAYSEAYNNALPFLAYGALERKFLRELDNDPF